MVLKSGTGTVLTKSSVVCRPQRWRGGPMIQPAAHHLWIVWLTWIIRCVRDRLVVSSILFFRRRAQRLSNLADETWLTRTPLCIHFISLVNGPPGVRGGHSPAPARTNLIGHLCVPVVQSRFGIGKQTVIRLILNRPGSYLLITFRDIRPSSPRTRSPTVPNIEPLLTRVFFFAAFLKQVFKAQTSPAPRSQPN